MSSAIRLMENKDKDAVLEMMRTFYASPAVLSNGSEEIFAADVDACVGDNPYLEGYVVEREGNILGYSMVAKSFSTEFGKRCIWIEDLYLKDAFRGLGLGRQMLDFIMEKYEGCLFRLEAEAENEKAIRVYKACGFTELPYLELKK